MPLLTGNVYLGFLPVTLPDGTTWAKVFIVSMLSTQNDALERLGRALIRHAQNCEVTGDPLQLSDVERLMSHAGGFALTKKGEALIYTAGTEPASVAVWIEPSW